MVISLTLRQIANLPWSLEKSKWRKFSEMRESLEKIGKSMVETTCDVPSFCVFFHIFPLSFEDVPKKYDVRVYLVRNPNSVQNYQGLGRNM